MRDKLHLPHRSTADGRWTVAVTPETAGWDRTGLRVLELAPGASHRFVTHGEEMIVLSLAGSCTVICAGQRVEVAGRRSVFAGVSDFVYLPIDADVTISSEAGGRFALPSARAQRRLPFRYAPADAVPVEIRGAGQCTRQINNFGAADVFEADRLIAVEVITPSGNWSSYPPHKHDEERPGHETVLEEIYYYEIDVAGAGRHGIDTDDSPGRHIAPHTVGGPGMGYQRVYGTADRPLDVLAEVRSGDVVLIPYGYHGPCMAAPGYDMYYLNAMAGPGSERAWQVTFDPAHAWVARSWVAEKPDPRLPARSMRSVHS